MNVPPYSSPQLVPQPCVMVIFGASGDLTRRKLFPALYELASQHALPPEFSLVGTAGRAMNHDEFGRKMKAAAETFSGAPMEASAWDQLAQGLYYLSADFQDVESYRKLAALLSDVDRGRGTRGNCVFYLATPPSLYSEIIRGLAAAGLNPPKKGWSHIVIEKPFGRDLASARALNRELAQVFEEDQVYRIDHYLGKETVQNILVSRFSSGIFEPIWNRRYVDNVQITVAEDLGTGSRAKYYEESGALRDMLQSHMLQLLALTAMEREAAGRSDMRQAGFDELFVRRGLRHEGRRRIPAAARRLHAGRRDTVRPAQRCGDRLVARPADSRCVAVRAGCRLTLLSGRDVGTGRSGGTSPRVGTHMEGTSGLAGVGFDRIAYWENAYE